MNAANLSYTPYMKEIISKNDSLSMDNYSIISPDGEYAIITHGATACVCDTNTARQIASFTFGKESSNQTISTIEFFTPFKGFIVATTSDHGFEHQSFIYLVDICKSTVIKTIRVPFEVFSMEFIDHNLPQSTLNMHVWHPLLASFHGILVLGSCDGCVVFLDLRLHETQWHEERGVCGVMEVKCESDFQRGTNKHYMLVISVEKDSQITALKYLPKTHLLCIGSSKGLIHLCQLASSELCSLNRNDKTDLQITSFVFHEPENDPKNICYLWVVLCAETVLNRSQSEREGNKSQLCLLQLHFQNRTWVPSVGFVYDGFLTARMSFSHYLAPCVVDLNGDDEEDDNDDYDVSLMCKLQCLTVQPSKYHCAFKDNMNSNNNTSLTSESVNGNTTYDGDANGSMIEKGIFECNEENKHSSLMTMVWEIKKEKLSSLTSSSSSSSSYFFLMFDLNQWYFARMPKNINDYSRGMVRGAAYMNVKKLSIPTNHNIMTMQVARAEPIMRQLYPQEASDTLHCSDFYLKCVGDDGIISSKILSPIIEFLEEIKRMKTEDLIKDMKRVLDRASMLKLIPPSIHPSRLHDDDTKEDEDDDEEDEINFKLKNKQLLSFFNMLLNENLSVIINLITHSVVPGQKYSIDLRLLSSWASSVVVYVKNTYQRLIKPYLLLGGVKLENDSICSLLHVKKVAQSMNVVFECLCAASKQLSEHYAEMHRALVSRWEVLKVLRAHMDVVLWFLRQNFQCDWVKDGKIGKDLFEQYLATKNETGILMVEELVSLIGDDLQRHLQQDLCIYPPSRVESVLHLYLLANIPLIHKHTIFIYFLLDLTSSQPSQKRDKALLSFAHHFKLHADVVKMVQALWLLDHQQYLASFKVMSKIDFTKVPPFTDLIITTIRLYLSNKLFSQGLSLSYMHLHPLIHQSENLASLFLEVLIANRRVMEALEVLQDHLPHRVSFFAALIKIHAKNEFMAEMKRLRWELNLGPSYQLMLGVLKQIDPAQWILYRVFSADVDATKSGLGDSCSSLALSMQKLISRRCAIELYQHINLPNHSLKPPITSKITPKHTILKDETSTTKPLSTIDISVKTTINLNTPTCHQQIISLKDLDLLKMAPLTANDNPLKSSQPHRSILLKRRFADSPSSSAKRIRFASHLTPQMPKLLFNERKEKEENNVGVATSLRRTPLKTFINSDKVDNENTSIIGNNFINVETDDNVNLDYAKEDISMSSLIDQSAVIAEENISDETEETCNTSHYKDRLVHTDKIEIIESDEKVKNEYNLSIKTPTCKVSTIDADDNVDSQEPGRTSADFKFVVKPRVPLRRHSQATLSHITASNTAIPSSLKLSIVPSEVEASSLYEVVKRRRSGGAILSRRSLLADDAEEEEVGMGGDAEGVKDFRHVEGKDDWGKIDEEDGGDEGKIDEEDIGDGGKIDKEDGGDGMKNNNRNDNVKIAKDTKDEKNDQEVDDISNDKIENESVKDDHEDEKMSEEGNDGEMVIQEDSDKEDIESDEDKNAEMNCEDDSKNKSEEEDEEEDVPGENDDVKKSEKEHLVADEVAETNPKIEDDDKNNDEIDESIHRGADDGSNTKKIDITLSAENKLDTTLKATKSPQTPSPSISLTPKHTSVDTPLTSSPSFDTGAPSNLDAFPCEEASEKDNEGDDEEDRSSDARVISPIKKDGRGDMLEDYVSEVRKNYRKSNFGSMYSSSFLVVDEGLGVPCNEEVIACSTDVESTCSEAHANKMDVSTTSATSSQFLSVATESDVTSITNDDVSGDNEKDDVLTSMVKPKIKRVRQYNIRRSSRIAKHYTTDEEVPSKEEVSRPKKKHKKSASLEESESAVSDASSVNKGDKSVKMTVKASLAKKVASKITKEEKKNLKSKNVTEGVNSDVEVYKRSYRMRRGNKTVNDIAEENRPFTDDEALKSAQPSAEKATSKAARAKVYPPSPSKAAPATRNKTAAKDTKSALMLDGKMISESRLRHANEGALTPAQKLVRLKRLQRLEKEQGKEKSIEKEESKKVTPKEASSTSTKIEVKTTRHFSKPIPVQDKELAAKPSSKKSYVFSPPLTRSKNRRH